MAYFEPLFPILTDYPFRHLRYHFRMKEVLGCESKAQGQAKTCPLLVSYDVEEKGIGQVAAFTKRVPNSKEVTLAFRGAAQPRSGSC